MKLIAAAFLASSLCFAQAPVTAPAPTVEQLKAQIQTLQTTSQQYLKELQATPEYQQYAAVRQQIEDTQVRLMQLTIAQAAAKH